MHRLSKLLIITLLLIMLPTVAKAACSITIDGQELTCRDANGNIIEPFVENGTTYVPLRAVSSAFNISVAWEQETKTVYLGETGGSPVLNEYINIFADGEEFIPCDINGVRVYPIMRNDTTYLPIRGLGQLLGKNIAWDATAQQAILTTPASTAALSYFETALSNTAAFPNLSAFIVFEGNLSLSGATLSTVTNSSTESYHSSGFSLDAFLPDDYQKGVTYNGEGKYTISVPSDKLKEDFFLKQILVKRNTPTDFSYIYIDVVTQSGYITDITARFTGDVTYNNIQFDEDIKITAQLLYPTDFVFPQIPYPQILSAADEYIPADTNESSDSSMILKCIDDYMTYALSAQSKNITSMLHPDDFKLLFSNKSSAQFGVDISTMNKHLNQIFKNAIKPYTVESMLYTDAPTMGIAPDKTAKVVVLMDGIDPLELIFIKKAEIWYISYPTVKLLF